MANRPALVVGSDGLPQQIQSGDTLTAPAVAASGTVTGSNLSGTNTGDQTITLTSDVTGTGTGSFAVTIANGVVTFAKMQTVSTNVLLGNDGSGTAVQEITCTQAGRDLLDDANAAAQRTTLGATTVGGNLFTLTNPSAISFPRINADNTVTAESAATHRSSLGLGTAATLASDTDGALAANSDSNVPTQKAVKTYVDAVAAGLKWKQSVRVATTAAGTLASGFENGDTIDGVTLATGDRILIKNQSSATENGIYVVAASGAPARSTDADSGTELVSAAVFVQAGTANADRAWVCANDSITLGSTSIAWTAFASVVGALVAANNLSDLASASTARGNLGLGTAATANTGTSGNNVPFLDGANTWSAAQSVTVTDGTANGVTNVLNLSHRTSGTPAVNLGTALAFRGETSTTDDTLMGELYYAWTNITHATRQSEGAVSSYYGSNQSRAARWATDSGANPLIGFLGAAPALRQSGDAGTALVNFGLMTGVPTFAAANLTGRVVTNVIQLQDQRSSGTNGGTSVAAAWTTHALNTEVLDTGSHCSLGSNQFTLLAGTYRVRGSCVLHRGDVSMVRVRNVSDNVTVAQSLNLYANSAAAYAMVAPIAEGATFTIASSKVFELQYYVQTALATNGLGAASSAGTEIYANVWIEREAG